MTDTPPAAIGTAYVDPVWSAPTETTPLALCDGSCGDPETHGLHHEPLGL